MLKEHGPDDLVPALRCALQGQRFTSPALAEQTSPTVSVRTSRPPGPDLPALNATQWAHQLARASRRVCAQSSQLRAHALQTILASQQLCAAAAVTHASAARILATRSTDTNFLL